MNMKDITLTDEDIQRVLSEAAEMINGPRGTEILSTYFEGTDIEVDQQEIEPIIDEVAQHYGTRAKKELMDAFSGHWGRQVKNVAEQIIWDAGTYGTLAREVLDRWLKEHAVACLVRPSQRNV